MHKSLKLSIFLAFSLFVFWLTFGFVGSSLAALFRTAIDWFLGLILKLFHAENAVRGFWGLVRTGLFPVFGVLLGFLPQLLVLSICISCLEQSGLLRGNRRLMHIVLGFGCTTLAVNSLNKCDGCDECKRTSTMLSFVPCGGMMPIMMLFGCTVLGLHFLVIYMLYLFSVMLGMIFLLQKKQSVTKNFEPPEVKARFSIKQIGRSVLSNAAEFLHRISGTVIIAATLLYFLTHYTFGFAFTEDITKSALYGITGVLAPLFAPLGLNNPALIACLISGVIVKEMIVASAALFAASGLVASTVSPLALTTASGISFMLFALLCPPCIPAITAMKSKNGRPATVRIVVTNLMVAYAVSCAFYLIYQLVL